MVSGEPPSAYSDCTCGVPQGSVLGPLLFTVYTKDVPHQLYLLGVTCQMCADDILIDCSATDIAVINAVLSDSVSTLSRYLQSRGLILNAAKTQVLGNSAIQRDVTCNGFKLKQSRSARYLGFVLDDELNGDAHVSSVSKKASKKLRVFWQARHCLTQRVAKLFYVAVFLPDILYASTVYYPLLSASLKAKVFRLFKRGLRCAMQAAPRTPTALILSSLSLFTLEQEVMCKTAVLMHRLCYKYASPLLNSLATFVCRTQGAHTRGETSMQLLIPRAHKSIGEKRTVHVGSILWNSLPFSTRQLASRAQFAAVFRDKV